MASVAAVASLTYGYFTPPGYLVPPLIRGNKILQLSIFTSVALMAKYKVIMAFVLFRKKEMDYFHIFTVHSIVPLGEIEMRNLVSISSIFLQAEDK